MWALFSCQNFVVGVPAVISIAAKKTQIAVPPTSPMVATKAVRVPSVAPWSGVKAVAVVGKEWTAPRVETVVGGRNGTNIKLIFYKFY